MIENQVCEAIFLLDKLNHYLSGEDSIFCQKDTLQRALFIGNYTFTQIHHCTIIKIYSVLLVNLSQVSDTCNQKHLNSQISKKNLFY